MYRYLAIVWHPLDVTAARTLDSCNTAAFRQPQWSVAHQGAGMLVLHVDATRGAAATHVLPRGEGVVLGTLFERSPAAHPTSAPRLDESQARRIIDTAGQHLIDCYWGTYLALLHDAKAQRHYVLRDPVGSLRCYRFRHAGLEIFFSHVQDCVALLPTLQWKVNRRHLRDWMFLTSATNDETGLENVSRFPRGERIDVSPTGSTRSVVWDPVSFAAAETWHQPAQAARELRTAVQSVVDTWAARYARVALRLSGGLDSSIVAGCLAHAASKPQLTFLNLSIEVQGKQQPMSLPGLDAHTLAKVRSIAMHGDERIFARQVADRWNIPLIERPRNLVLDLRRMDRAPPAPSPSLYFTTAEMDDAKLELIASHGVQSFFTGLSGDSVLLATLQPLAAIDFAYRHGLSRELWRQIMDSAALSRDSVWSVLAKTVKHGLFRRPYKKRHPLADLPTLLSAELLQDLRMDEWSDDLSKRADSSRLPPGKRNHVQGVAAAHYDFIFHSGDSTDDVDPLNTQPVWETALRIPTYTLLTGGISRGLARIAFADLLPDEIRKRQSKGTGHFFYQQVVRRNRDYLRERLADGLLVQHHYLDRERLLACLALEDPSVMVAPASLLTYLSAEIWLQHWSTVNQRITSAQPLQSAAV